MSEHIIKIIPSNPFAKLSIEVLEEAKNFLKTNVMCDSVDIECSEYSMFVDCGSNLEKISCPKCEAEISFEWWGDKMNKASERSFQVLEIKLPCCGETVSLNDLKYNFECGFSSSVIEILNPANDIERSMINSIQRILGTNVNIINAHI